MVRSAPSVAVLLALTLGGGCVVSSACELACVYRAATTTTTGSTAREGASPCHEPQPDDVGGPVVTPSLSSRTTCEHGGATEPFIVSSPSNLKLTAGVVDGVSLSACAAPAPARVGQMLHGHTPPGSSLALALPLRI
jgi:hypothetical protein